MGGAGLAEIVGLLYQNRDYLRSSVARLALALRAPNAGLDSIPT